MRCSGHRERARAGLPLLVHGTASEPSRAHMWARARHGVLQHAWQVRTAIHAISPKLAVQYCHGCSASIVHARSTPLARGGQPVPRPPYACSRWRCRGAPATRRRQRAPAKLTRPGRSYRNRAVLAHAQLSAPMRVYTRVSLGGPTHHAASSSLRASRRRSKARP